MPRSKKAVVEQEQPRKRPPARTPEARENQLISLAIDLAEKQLSEGTASSQVITHYLKLGTTREKIEKEMLVQKSEHLKAQTEAIRNAEKSEEIYQKAMDAMRAYSGRGNSRAD